MLSAPGEATIPADARHRGLTQFAAWHWLAVYALILGAWWVMFRQAVPPGILESATLYGAEFWLDLCSVAVSGIGFGELVAMWLLMSLAMMLPTFVPALATYDRLRLAGAGNRFGFIELILGYISVWALYSIAMAVLQRQIVPTPVAAGGGEAVNLRLGAAIVAAAGLYQFMPIKDACLAKCRTPFMFFMANWRSSPFNELRLGLKLGVICVGCCWLLMAISLVSGAMGLLWMGLATALMCMEKLPEFGRRVSRPVGMALLGGAVILAVNGA